MKKINQAKSAQFKTELHQNSEHLDHQKHCCKNEKQDADEENICKPNFSLEYIRTILKAKKI